MRRRGFDGTRRMSPRPPTYRVHLTLARRDAERAMMVLSEICWPPAAAVGFNESADGSFGLDAWFDEDPDVSMLEGALAAQGIEAIAAPAKQVEEIDWVAKSQAGLGLVCAGRFIVHGSHDRHLARRSRYAIEIDAGQAFGTAHHGSTLGCLMAIDDLAKRACMTRVLDIGTGTGVLAIAAARVWRAEIVASDIDPVATEVTKENIRSNAMSRYIRTVTATGLDHPAIRQQGPYDLIIANILARPLIAMAHDIAGASRRGGVVILSGMTRGQAGRVAAAYGAAGFARLRQFTFSDWATLTLRRK